MENNTEYATKTRKVEKDVSLNGVPLKKVSIEELAEYRRKKIPSLVIKTEKGLFYAPIKLLNMSTSNFLKVHQCAFCHRLSAASDADGGCAKVRAGSTGIENYPWIIQGYETFATSHDYFVVAKCHHWQAYPTRKKPTIDQSQRARRTLIDWWYN